MNDQTVADPTERPDRSERSSHQPGMTSPDISVVFPVYNEAGNLHALYEETADVLARHFPTWEMIFVDDGSVDDSYERLVELHNQDPRVNVIKFTANFGQSAALDAGMKRAQGDVVVTMDADGQNDPADIPKLVRTLRTEGYDCVVGWRKQRHDPLTKRIFSKMAGVIRRFFLNTDLHDYGCTLKAFTNETAHAINIRGEMHRYVPPILKWRGYTVGEVEVNHRPRHRGETKYGWDRLPKGFMDMLNVWFWQKYSGRPIHVFGGLGIVAACIGGMAGLYAVYLKLIVGASLSDTALPLFAAFMILLGIQFFISGILADISIRNYFQLRDSRGYRIGHVATTDATPAQYGPSEHSRRNDGQTAVFIDE